MNTLRALLEDAGLDGSFLLADIPILAICQDSRLCRPGSLFVAICGLHADGTTYIDEAKANGAVCICSQGPSGYDENGVPHIQAKAPRPAFACLCAAFYDHPARDLHIIGVTGTDGKSTTCEYLYGMLRQNGHRTGLFGTVSIDDGTGKRPSPYRQSTPEADILQHFLARCVEHSVEYVVLECTSHALDSRLDRLATIAYDAAIVTTVSSEHLEFHGTLASYVDAKCNLVRRLKKGGIFVSTTTNPHLEAFLSEVPPTCRTFVLGRDIAFSTQKGEGGGIPTTVGRRTFRVPVALPCLASNAALACITASLLLGRPLGTMLSFLEKIEPVTGRMQVVPNDAGLHIVIDFAHTADAYRNIFPAMALQKKAGRLIAVFGAAGNRDRTKRRPMGAVAAAHADLLILTEEDSRSEPDETIFGDIEEGIGGTVPFETIVDRKKAIERAIELAAPGDTVLFLGKGHESSIERKDGKIPWNERQAVENALKEKQRS